MKLADIRRIFLAHQDIDHIGSVLCYHGGLAQREVGSQLRDLAGIGS